MSRLSRPWIVLGNPDNRRVTMFQAALREAELSPAWVVAYSDYLRDPSVLEQSLDQQPNAVLRIESPGENWAVERELIARGAETSLDASVARRLRADAGRVRSPRQWFAGFSVVLRELEVELARRPGIHVPNHPAAIRTLFDKPACHARLAAAGVSVPRALPPVASYDELLAAMRTAGMSRVFVKLASGSSSSGVVAFSLGGTRPLAVTSLEIMRRSGGVRFYNNLQLSRYDRDRDLRSMFDFLCREGTHVEEWLPKISQGDRNLDLRVVTIAGRMRHTVVRTSRSPLTNLHLGNRRGDLAALKQAAGRRWRIVRDVCEAAAATFPDALTVGWDVLVTPGFRRATILEGNAFGDLLPNVLDRGRSTYAAVIAAAFRRPGTRTVP